MSRLNPCPVCHGTSWCLVDEHGADAICMRVESGAVKALPKGGYLHVFTDTPQRDRPRYRTLRLPPSTPSRADLPTLAADYKAALRPERLDALAADLGLTAPSLARLNVGWAFDAGGNRGFDAGDVLRCGDAARLWSFPMSSGDGTVVGIRLRDARGAKWSVTGGREGLFLPAGLGDVDTLLITEGPTDCAAALDLGFAAVGRPSCTGATSHVVTLVRRLRVRRAIIVADGDAPGQRGAASLASVLTTYCTEVRLVTPPEGIKDMRAWRVVGATTDDVSELVERSAPRRLAMVARTRTHGKAVTR